MPYGKLLELRVEFERQSDAIERMTSRLREFGTAELAVPHAFFDELDEVAKPLTTPMPTFAVRG